MRRLSAALLPRVSAQTYANVQNHDLKAEGLSFPGIPIPSVVGPLSNYDFRVYAQQNVIDLRKLSRAQGQRTRSRRRQDG